MSMRHCSEGGCVYFPEHWLALIENQIERTGYCHKHAVEHGLTKPENVVIEERKPVGLIDKAEAMMVRLFGNTPVIPAIEPEPMYFTDLNGIRKETPF